MRKFIISSVTVFGLVFLGGCESSPNVKGYQPLAEIVNEDYIYDNEGKKTNVWGYLDFSNISLKENTIDRQPSWWDKPRDGGKSYFNLKSYKNDEAGKTTRVFIRGDINKYKRVFTRIRGMKEDTAENNTLILVKVTIRSYTARYNFNSSIKLILEVNSPADISFQEIKEH